jgi:hypothetical protein
MRLTRFAAVALLLWLPAASALADASAERDIKAFLTSVYSHYKGEDTEYDPTGKIAPQLFTADLVALIRENQKLAAKTGDSALDSDPFCDCQDVAGMRVEIGKITVAGPADATAIVNLRFTPDGKPVTNALRYVFKKERGKWRIQNIVSDGGNTSFLSYLQTENKELKAERKSP